MSEDRSRLMLRHAAQNSNIEINETGMIRTPFPKENPISIQVLNPDFVTDLLNVLYFYEVDPNRCGPSKESTAKEKKKVQTSYYFGYTKDSKIPAFKWANYDRRLKTLVLQHYITSIRQLDQGRLSTEEKMLFTSDTSTTNLSSMTPEQREHGKLSILAKDMITDHMFVEDENNLDTEIAHDQACTHMNVKNKPGAGNTNQAKRMAFERQENTWLNLLKRTRNILSDIYCWVLHVFASRQIKSELEQVHSDHMYAQANLSEIEEPTQFTAEILVDYIITKYVSDNENLVVNLTRRFELILRYKGEKLIEWLDRLVALVQNLQEARKGDHDALTPAELKLLWEDTYAGNITTDENLRIKGLLPTNADELAMVANYSTGVFNTLAFRKILVDKANDLTYYNEPDKRVIQFNLARYTKREGAGTPDYRNPTQKARDTPKRTQAKPKVAVRQVARKRQQGQDRKHNRNQSTSNNRPCTHPGCVVRNVQHTHTTEQCNYRNGGDGTPSKRYKPSGKGKGKSPGKGKPSRQPATRHAPALATTGTPVGTRDLSHIKCFNCNKNGHFATNCTEPKSVRRLDKFPSFRNMLLSAFPDVDDQQIANEIVEKYDTACCHTCLRADCVGGHCDPNDRDFHDKIPGIMQTLRENPDLTEAMRAANAEFTTNSVNAPLTVNSYFAYYPSMDYPSKPTRTNYFDEQTYGAEGYNVSSGGNGKAEWDQDEDGYEENFEENRESSHDHDMNSNHEDGGDETDISPCGGVELDPE